MNKIDEDEVRTVHIKCRHYIKSDLDGCASGFDCYNIISHSIWKFCDQHGNMKLTWTEYIIQRNNFK